MSTSAETNGSAPEEAAHADALSPLEIKVSSDIIGKVRDHVTEIGGLLQGLPTATPTTEAVPAPSPDSSTSKSETTDKDGKAEPKPANPDEETNGSDKITKKGRVLEVLHSDKETVDSVPTSAAQKRREGEYAFTYVKNVVDETYRSSLIELYDKELIKALEKARVESRPTYYCDGRETFPTLLASPFEDIVWISDRLKRLASDMSDTSAQTASDLKLLLKYVREDPSLAPYYETSQSRPLNIAWDNIWTLFPAGTEVVTRMFLDTPQIMLIQDPPYQTGADSAVDLRDENTNGRWLIREQWRIKAWCYDHDGKDWVRSCHDLLIKKYSGERAINELPCYPIANDKEQATLRKNRIAEGRRFAEFHNTKKPSRFNYDESVMIDKQSENRSLFSAESMSPWFRQRYFGEYGIELVTSKVKQEVIIDPEPWNDRYGTLHIGTSEPSSLSRPEKDMSDSAFMPTPEGEMLRFCPPRFVGCLPKDRLIAQFKMSAVGDDKSIIHKDTSLFEHALQLDKVTKDLLLGQVQYQKDELSQGMDIIPGKGNNLVVLLHGPPGVGKTLTAETVAKATNRPLLNTTIGDVGTDSSRAERNLARIFSVAARWQAILLIDEADAFLEKRDANALPERNAFVTVMLRILEYHTGIVMLTTNRLTTIDSAVQSRIHLAIQYKELEVKECITIFKTSVDRSNVAYKSEKLEEIVRWLTETGLYDQHYPKKAWNGREIRNLVTGAVAHMTFRGDKGLTLDHVKAVFKTTREFKEQLEEQMMLWKRDNQGVSRGGR